MGTVEWTNWSSHRNVGRFTAQRVADIDSPASLIRIAFEWRDGWFFSGGAEYYLDRAAYRARRYRLRDFPGHRSSPQRHWYRTTTECVGVDWCNVAGSPKALHVDLAYTHRLGGGGTDQLNGRQSVVHRRTASNQLMSAASADTPMSLSLALVVSLGRSRSRAVKTAVP